MVEERACAFFGGDKRMQVAADRLEEAGYSVCRIGLGGNERASEWDDDVAHCRCLILPTPCTQDERGVYAPLCERPILWSRICPYLHRGQILMGGKIPHSWRICAERQGCRVVELTDSDRLARKNALPTAEGALGIALQTMPRTVWGSNSLILGYGRIAKCLAPMLLALGAKVTVVARDHEARGEAMARGCDARSFSHLKESCEQADWICNTVPARVLDREALSHCRRDCTVVDLASRPGGVDSAAAEEMGLTVIWALGLPGKIAPISAGEFLYDEIRQVLEGGEEK